MEDDKFKISNGACSYGPGKLESSSQPLEKTTADHWTGESKDGGLLNWCLHVTLRRAGFSPLGNRPNALDTV